MENIEVNFIAVLVAAAASVGLGATWFSPALFGRNWMGGIGKTPEQIQKDFSPIKPLLAFIGSATTAIALTVLFNLADVDSILSGVLIGVIAVFALHVTSTATLYLFEHRSSKLFLNVTGYDLVSTAIMSAIVTAWR